MTGDTFTYHGAELRYVDHPYNTTRLNERAVELAIARAWLDDADRSDCGLEVGNVTGHYWPGTHRVVDRYEAAEGVEPLDVFEVGGRYDWVLAISALEHVRWDWPERRQRNGASLALGHLRGLLGSGGRMLVTVPLGHHRHLDRVLLAGATSADRACTLVRDGDGWTQTAALTWKAYGASTPWAEAVWIGEWSP
jgi:hypothetical protein